MEYVPETLEDHLRQPYRTTSNVQIIKNAWEAVKDLHMVEYLHTDITPSSITVKNGTQIVLCRLEKCRKQEDSDEMFIDTST